MYSLLNTFGLAVVQVNNMENNMIIITKSQSLIRLTPVTKPWTEVDGLPQSR